MKNILVCGVPNSNNLGDRIIAETMSYLLESEKSYNTVNFDINQGVVNKEISEAKIALNASNFKKKITPNLLRKVKSYYLQMSNKKTMLDLEKYVGDADLIVVGGGHLFIDTYLSFPLALKKIKDEAKKQNKTLIISFVGARGPWSKLGKKYFKEILEYASKITVRDKDSKSFLSSMFPSMENKIVAMSDPALFVKDIINKNEVYSDNRKSIGLGVMDPYEIKRHTGQYWNREQCANWWKNLSSEFIEKGYKVNIFTNGAATDNAFVEFYLKNINDSENIYFHSYPTKTSDIYDAIKSNDIIIAQRLHACLPSISIGKPTFGIMWDNKIKSIFEELGLEKYLIKYDVEAKELANYIFNNINSKSNHSNREKIKDKRQEMKNYIRNL